MIAPARIITDPTLPRPSWQASCAEFPALVIPDSLPAYTREYLAQLDTAISKAARDGSVSAESFRNSAAAYRQAGQTMHAENAARMAALVELDARLFTAGTIHNYTPDGTTKYFLGLYISLLEKQAVDRLEKMA